jgi:thiol-disulfide isomerase/thioredoxin
MTVTISRWLRRRTGILLLLLVGGSGQTAGTPFTLFQAPQQLPMLQFHGADNQRLSLHDFRGKPVLFHLWATWCVPCREELPALDRLQAKLADQRLAIVAVALDRQGQAVVRPFFGKSGIEHLQIYTDASSRLLSAVNAPGLPVTLLIDAQGREIARHVGAVEWDAPAMEAFLRELSGADAPSKPVGMTRIAELAWIY